MFVSRDNLINWLRGEFAEEQCGGFERLKRIPDTHVIRFLDHFASLNAVEQSDLKLVLAEWSSYRFAELAIPKKISEKFSRATAFPGLVGGVRYSGKMGAPQLKYQVEVQGNGLTITAPNVCFESILGVGFGRWDYLTQENSERSVDLLCELVEYVAGVPQRIPT